MHCTYFVSLFVHTSIGALEDPTPVACPPPARSFATRAGPTCVLGAEIGPSRRPSKPGPGAGPGLSPHRRAVYGRAPSSGLPKSSAATTYRLSRFTLCGGWGVGWRVRDVVVVYESKREGPLLG